MSRLKRLKKKAEIFEYKQTLFGTLMVTKNPNLEDLNNIKNQNINEGFKGIINNDLYIWNLQFSIEDINQYLTVFITTSGLRINAYYNKCELDATESMSIKQIVDSIKLYPMVFTNDYFYYIKNANDSTNYRIEENKWYSLNKLKNIVV